VLGVGVCVGFWLLGKLALLPCSVLDYLLPRVLSLKNVYVRDLQISYLVVVKTRIIGCSSK